MPVFSKVDPKAAAELGVSVMRVPAYSPFDISQCAHHGAPAFLTPEALDEIARLTVANLIAFDNVWPFLPGTVMK